jgi:hypothetical protein
MRASGVRGLLIYCGDYHCSNWTAISAYRWPDDVRLSDIEPRFTCQACGQRGCKCLPELPLGGRGASRDKLKSSHRLMRNLYSITTNQAAIIALFRAINHNVGNLPPMPRTIRHP